MKPVRKAKTVQIGAKLLENSLYPYTFYILSRDITLFSGKLFLGSMHKLRYNKYI